MNRQHFAVPRWSSGAAIAITLGTCLSVAPRASAATFGAFGDSLGDEYQFINGPRSHARNYVELLATQRGLDFGAFSTVSRGEPRNQGYANNWSNAGELLPNGVTTGELGPTGETAGLAGQVAAGQVDVVFLTVGGNDFESVLSGADLTTVVQNGLTNEVTAIDTILAANPNVKVLVANVPDVTEIPEIQFLIKANPALAPEAAQVSSAIDLYNTQLSAQLAADTRVAIVDDNAILKEGLANPVVDGVTIDTLDPSPDANHLFADEIHPGTIGQGFLANGFINALDTKFGFNITPFSQHELRTLAASFAVPLPPGLWASLSCLPMALWLARRSQK
jgi:phospholipase/lecithinase/hemolysin